MGLSLISGSSSSAAFLAAAMRDSASALAPRCSEKMAWQSGASHQDQAHSS